MAWQSKMRDRGGQEWGFFPAALAISVALHLLVLWSGAVRLPAGETPGVPLPLVAHLPPPFAEGPAPAPPAEPSPDSAREQTATHAPVRTGTVRENPVAKAPPARREAAQGGPPPPDNVPVLAPEVPAAAMFPDPPTAGTSPVPVPSPELPGKASATEGADAGALLEYRWALTGKAGKPDITLPAGERASAGRVDIRVTVTPLRTQKVEVAQTSGVRLLDNEALRIMQAAAARAPVPDALKGRPFSVVLPVRFGPESP